MSADANTSGLSLYARGALRAIVNGRSELLQALVEDYQPLTQQNVSMGLYSTSSTNWGSTTSVRWSSGVQTVLTGNLTSQLSQGTMAAAANQSYAQDLAETNWSSWGSTLASSNSQEIQNADPGSSPTQSPQTSGLGSLLGQILGTGLLSL